MVPRTQLNSDEKLEATLELPCVLHTFCNGGKSVKDMDSKSLFIGIVIGSVIGLILGIFLEASLFIV